MPERTKLDFASIRASVPIDSVLAHYGVETRKRNGTYLVANCPLPSHTSKESPLSFAINIEKNLWTCHSDSCRKGSGIRGGDVIDLVCLLEGTRLPLEGAKKLAELFPQSGEARPAAPAPVEKNKPLAFTLKDINPEHPMIQGRGISVETAREFGIGFFPGKGSMQNRVVVPLLEDGSLIGYAGRFCGEPDKDNPKWKLPAGLRLTFLYGLERCDPAKLLILTEGFWAPPYFFQRGAQCASLMGKNLTDQQFERLAPFHDICVALDNDAAGNEAAAKVIARLKAGHKVFKASLKEG